MIQKLYFNVRLKFKVSPAYPAAETQTEI